MIQVGRYDQVELDGRSAFSPSSPATAEDRADGLVEQVEQVDDSNISPTKNNWEEEERGRDVKGEEREMLMQQLCARAKQCAAVSSKLAEEKGNGNKERNKLLEENASIAREMERVVSILFSPNQNVESKDSVGDEDEKRSDDEELEDFQKKRRAILGRNKPSYDSAEKPSVLERQSLFQDLEELKRSHGKLGWRLAKGLDRRREIESNLARKSRELQSQVDSLKAKLSEERTRGNRLLEELAHGKQQQKATEGNLARALQAKDSFGKTLEQETNKAWREFQDAKRQHETELRTLRTDFALASEQLSAARIEVDILRGKLKAAAGSLEQKSQRLDHSVSHFKRDSSELRQRCAHAENRAAELERECALLRETVAMEREAQKAQVSEVRLRNEEARLANLSLQDKITDLADRLAEQEQTAQRANSAREKERHAVSQLRESLDALRLKISSVDRERSRCAERAQRAEQAVHEMQQQQQESAENSAAERLELLRKRAAELESTATHFEEKAADFGRQVQEERRLRAEAELAAAQAASALKSLQSVSKDLYASRNNALRMLQQQQEQHEQRMQALEQTRRSDLERIKELEQDDRAARELETSALREEVRRLHKSIHDQALTIHELSA